MSAAAWIGQARGSLARRRAGKRLMLGDGVVYQPGDNQTNGNRRLDAKCAVLPFLHELDDLIEERYQGRTVRVKNTSGGSWAAGTLLAPPLSGAVTTPSSNVATSSPSAGSSVVITVAGTYAVGQLVTITTTGILTGALDLVDKTYVSATGAGTITVDQLDNNHTLPTVALDSAINAVVAVASTGVHAEWVVGTAIANGAYGDAFGCIEITGLDTSGYSAAGVAVYLGAAGAATGTAPTKTTTNVSQVVGLVKVKDATVGIIKFFPGSKRFLWTPGGNGDVVGPASATDNAFAKFDGTTGKLLKDGVVAGTSANNLVQLNGSAQLPAVSGINITAINGSNIASGTVADARLSANVPLLNAANVYSSSIQTIKCDGDALHIGNVNLTHVWSFYTNSFPQFGSYTNDPIAFYTNNGAPQLTLNTDGTIVSTGPSIKLTGTSSGTCVLGVAAAAGTGTIFTLPATNGASGNVLSTDGSGVTSWAVAPLVAASGRATGKTATSGAVVSYSVGIADSTFIVSANVLVTTATVHNFTVTCTYTDEGNTSRVLVLQFSTLAGAFLTNIINTAGAVPYEGVPLHIRAKAGTTVAVLTDAGGTYTTVTYNIEAFIRKLQ